ncbi:MAG: DUF1385 domain-containing protein [Eubacterium sp.]|jgi:uncharacterized protein YqhQ|nr:DUF1385 domain-containing protein [Eubacterium sp.]
MRNNKLCSSGIGGQAVMEGIMMRNKDRYAVAVRQSDGSIVVDTQKFKGITSKCKLFQLPFIRGIFSFIDSLILGIKTLTFSAKFFDDEADYSDEPDKFEQWLTDKFGDKAEKVIMGFTVVFSIMIAIGLFMVLPLFIADIMERYVSWVTPGHVPVIEGVVKMILFIAYLLLISLMNDIKRTFMYHGAEHKCINCIENGHVLTVDNVRKSSRYHKRCGTSFLLVVLIISIVMFILIRTDIVWLRYVTRILLVPVIAGLSYEFIRKAGSSNNKVINVLSMPGMWMQKITTKEPTDDMIEVAIEAVEAVFDWEQYLDDNGIKRVSRRKVMPVDKQPLPKEYKKDRKGSGYNWKF